MHYVTASKNKIKEAAKLKQKKYREETGLFISEGFKILEEMLDECIKIKEIYALKEFKNDKISAPVYLTDEAGMKKIAQTESAPAVLTVAEKKKEDIENFKCLNKLALLENISDPGNLGTIIRSAAAFGVEGLILFGSCADLYSPKVIRSSAGNFFKIPIIHLNTIEELNKYFKNHVKISTALSKDNNISLKECSEIKRRIIMLGSEAKGLSDGLLESADKNIRLEMRNNVESLNLAVSASIIFYELSF